MRKLKIMLFLLLSTLYCMAEGPLAPGGQNEYRSKVLQIQEKMVFEQRLDEECGRMVDSFEARLILVGRETNMETRINDCLQLRREMQAYRDLLKDSRQRQLQIHGLIEAAAASGDVLPQVSGYLVESKDNLRRMGLKQQKALTRLERLIEMSRNMLKNIPAPRSFTNKSGMQMLLVRSGSTQFYISKEPVETGNVTWKQAKRSLARLSMEEKAEYRLPSSAEIQALAQKKFKCECAIWGQNAWEDGNVERNRMISRFGVTLYEVWDAGEFLGRQVNFGELGNARYGKLGFYAVTSLKTGRDVIWDSVLHDMSKQGKGVKK